MPRNWGTVVRYASRSLGWGRPIEEGDRSRRGRVRMRDGAVACVRSLDCSEEAEDRRWDRSMELMVVEQVTGQDSPERTRMFEEMDECRDLSTDKHALEEWGVVVDVRTWEGRKTYMLYADNMHLSSGNLGPADCDSMTGYVNGRIAGAERLSQGINADALMGDPAHRVLPKLSDALLRAELAEAVMSRLEEVCGTGLDKASYDRSYVHLRGILSHLRGVRDGLCDVRAETGRAQEPWSYRRINDRLCAG